MGKWYSAGHYRAIVGVELTASLRVIVCYSQLCARSGGDRRICWQPDGWLVGAGDFTNTHLQGHGEGEVLPRLSGRGWRRLLTGALVRERPL